MGDSQKIVPRIIETSTENIPSEVVPGTVILDRRTGQVYFDTSDGVRHQISGGAQSDYGISDETDASFIKNRPFYSRKSKLSGNIVKNPEPIDDSSGGFVCDRVNFLEDQSEDITVSVIVDPDTGETVTAQGHVSTMGKLGPSEAIPAQFASVIVLYVENDYGDFEIIFYDGIEPDPDSAVGMKLSDTRSMSMLDNISVNTIDVGKIKYIDPLFIKPYRPDYSETDPDSPNFISNKLIDMSRSYRTLKPETSYGEPYVQAIYGWGLPSDGIGELKLDVKFKDGTEERYYSYSSSTPSNFPTDTEEESKASFLVSTNFTRYDAESSSSVTICTITSAAGVEYGTDETYMGSLMLCAFDEEFFNTIDSFTLTGEFLSVKLIPQDLIYGLNQRFDKLMNDLNIAFDYYVTRFDTNYRELFDNVNDLESARNATIYMTNQQITRNLHNLPDLTDYLHDVSIANDDNFFYHSEIFRDGIGDVLKSFEISATNLTRCFASTRFTENDYVTTYTSYPPIWMYLKLLNAENIDFAFSDLDLMHSTKNPADEELPNDGVFSLTLCHDITHADATFIGFRIAACGRFRIEGDHSLGRRVKISGTSSTTFNFTIENFDKVRCQFYLDNLDFMDSIRFDHNSNSNGVSFIIDNVNYMVNIIDQLHDYSADGGELPTDKYCTFGSSGAALLSEEQIKVASDKGWKIN